MPKHLGWLVGLLLACWPVSAHATPILIIDSTGKLTGATGVNVEGTLYDVAFVDGTCVDLFSGCDEASDFMFTVESTALAASQALNDQVFVDGPLGAFDANPLLTAGCEPPPPTNVICFAMTPWLDADSLRRTSFYQHTSGIGDFAFLSYGIYVIDTTSMNHVWAKWTEADPVPVPEPATSSLFGLALLVIGARRWLARPA